MHNFSFSPTEIIICTRSNDGILRGSEAKSTHITISYISRVHVVILVNHNQNTVLTDNSSLLGYDILSIGKCSSTFRRNWLPSFLRPRDQEPPFFLCKIHPLVIYHIKTGISAAVCHNRFYKFYYYQSFYLPTDTQKSCFKRILKFTLKQLLHVSVQSPSSVSVLFELAKVIVIKIIS